MNNRSLAIILLIIATFFWGATFTFTKVLVKPLTTNYLLVLRFLIPALIILLIYFNTIKKELPAAIRSIPLLTFALISFLAILFQTIGLESTTPSNAGFITAFSYCASSICKKIFFSEIESLISSILRYL